MTRIVSQKFHNSDGMVTVTLTTSEGDKYTLPLTSDSADDIGREVLAGIGQLEGWLT